MKTSVAFRYEDVDPDRRARIERGVACLRRINSHESFQDWMGVGDAYIEMQHAAMALARVNQPKGGGYNVAYRVIVTANPDLDVSRRLPADRRLNSATATHATWMANPERRAAIEAWHAALPDEERQRLNHPTAVKRRYEKDHAAPKLDADGTAKPAGLKGEVARLQEELDTAQRRIGQLEKADNNVLLITRDASAEEILAVLESGVPGKLRRMWTLLGERLKSTTPTLASTAVPKTRKLNREPKDERGWDDPV